MDPSARTPAAIARLYRIIVPVSDIEAAAAFYAQLLGSPGARVSPGRHYFDCGGVVLACFDPSADGDDKSAAPLPEHLYFSVPSIERVYAAALRAGAAMSTEDVHGQPAGEIHRRPWGELSFYCTDPFGNPLCFVAEGTEFTG